MKRIGFTSLLPILIPLCLMLGAASPKLTAEMFGAARAGQPILVYSMVWIPLLEISMMIAHHIIPPKTIAASPSEQRNPADPAQPVSETDHAFNTLTTREPMVLRVIRLEGVPLAGIMAYATASLPPPCSQHASRAASILPLICLIFLFKPLMPRSDIPL